MLNAQTKTSELDVNQFTIEKIFTFGKQRKLFVEQKLDRSIKYEAFLFACNATAYCIK